MRTLAYYIATTLDGFIAREDGSLDDFPGDDAYPAPRGGLPKPPLA